MTTFKPKHAMIRTRLILIALALAGLLAYSAVQLAAGLLGTAGLA